MNMDTVLYVGEIAVLAIGAATIGINAIAVITPSDADNKWAARLTWLNDKLQMFVLPFIRSKRTPKE